jgi:hypothetical protein
MQQALSSERDQVAAPKKGTTEKMVRWSKRKDERAEGQGKSPSLVQK